MLRSCSYHMNLGQVFGMDIYKTFIKDINKKWTQVHGPPLWTQSMDHLVILWTWSIEPPTHGPGPMDHFRRPGPWTAHLMDHSWA